MEVPKPRVQDLDATRRSRATLYETGGLSVPLDGLLTQAGEVYFKFENTGPATLDIVVPYTYYSSVGPNTHLTSAYWAVPAAIDKSSFAGRMLCSIWSSL